MNVDVSPDGQTILFDLLGDLYTIPITGGTAARLTSGPAFDTEPVFSPDGKRIAFVSDRSGSDNIWLMDADGQNLHAFTHETTAAVTQPEWLMGEEFLLAARKAGGHWLYRADGSSTALEPYLKRGVPLGHGEAAWSRDGRFLYVTEYESLRRVDVTRGQSELVSQQGPKKSFRPIVSPDGQWLVFGSQLKNKTGLRLLNLATQAQRWLVYPLPDRDNSMLEGGTSPALPRFAFLPDGKTIILATGGTFQRLDVRTGALRPIHFRAAVEQMLSPSAALARKLAEQPGRIRTIRDAQRDRTGRRVVFTALGTIWFREGEGVARPLVEPPASLQPLVLREPALSPDGQTVAFVTWHDVEGGQLWRVPVTGGAPQQLTRMPGVYRHPVWSPDGSQLAYVREEETPNRSRARWIAGAVYVLPAAGGMPRRVVASQADDVPAFSTDGKAVLVLTRSMLGGLEGGISAAGAPAAATSTGNSSPPNLLAISLRTGDVDTLAVLPAGTEQVAVSPDGQSVAYTQGDAVYVASIRRVTGLSRKPVTVGESGGLWPSTRVAQERGLDLRWEADSRTVTWVHDSVLVRLNVARAVALAVTAPEGSTSIRTMEVKAEVTPLSLAVPPPKPSGSVALEGATVITMRGHEVLRDATVLVTGQRIAAVGPRDAIALPAGVRRIDMAGKTIIPGLIDLRGAVPLARDLLEGTNRVLAADLAFGVTTVRAVPAYDEAPEATLSAAAAYAERLESGAMTGARFLAAGAIVAAHAAELTSLEAARALVRRQQVLGATAIVQRVSLVRRQRQWLAAAACEAGLALIGESGDLHLALTMMADGYHTIQGTIPNAQLYDDVRRLVATSRTFYVPTLLVASGGRQGFWGKKGTAEDYFLETTNIRTDPTLQRFGLDTIGPMEWRRLEDYHFLAVSEQTARLALIDVPVAVGTAARRPGLGVHWEMWALGMGGLSAHDALRAATVTAAEALGLGSELGTIEVGKVADLIVLDADPLTDLRHSRATRYVMRAGALFDAATLAMLWPRVTPPLSLRNTRYDPPLVTPRHADRLATGILESTR